MDFTEDQIRRYARHIILPEVGGTGQARLAASKVLVIGAGGLGSPVVLYLAAAGVGTIGVIDDDDVDLTNLQRQVLHTTSRIGLAKVESARADSEVQSAEADVETARIALAHLMGCTDGAIPLADAEWPNPQAVASLAGKPGNIEARPDVQSADAHAKEAHALSRLAEAQSTRDITVGLQYEHFPPDGQSLLGAGFIKLMMNLWVDAAIIFAVVILNALLGFIQEGRAERALDSIRNMLSAEARVVRGGETRMIAADQLVPGDVVILESGDKIPADLRLVDAKNLRTEEAALTGESVPADKATDVAPANATVGDRHNMAFSGTMVVSGRASGIVVATGNETELGRINQLLASVSPLETPLLRQIKKFGYTITAAIGVISVLIFAYGKWGAGIDFIELFQAVVGIAVSLIPEGLPALITITLAIGVQRMAQRNAIIRRLPAVETLGSVSRICSDKTGTLTLMEMMVVSAVTAESSYQITGDGYAPEGEVRKDGKAAPSTCP